jgi:hypothetical protein
MENQGALTVAEGNHLYKTDVSLSFGGSKVQKNFVLRTTLDQMGVWKAKYVNTNVSPFEAHIKTVVKDAAIIDKEVWVFGIDSTQSADIVAAVKIACTWYKVGADKILNDVYVKNLNAEHESTMGSQALVNANKKLYASTCTALIDAAKQLNVKGNLNLWVISSNINEKIPQESLYESLRTGGATSVELDPNPYALLSGSNDGKRKALIKTNLHLAKLSIK